MAQAPILFLIFNRPDLTLIVFKKIKEARPPKLYIAADGPRENKENEAILCSEAISIVLNNIDWDCEIKTLFRKQNLGCKNAVSSAISWFFEHEEEGIILEDDILPDNSFFTFCTEMLERYRNNLSITQITGDNFMGSFSPEKSDYFYAKTGGIWGWATWRRCWLHFDQNIVSWGNPKEKKEIKRFLGNDKWFETFKGNFDRAYSRTQDSWGFQWVYTQLKLKGLSVIPTVNLIENIGFREDATHTKTANQTIQQNMKRHEIKSPYVSPTTLVANEKYAGFYFSLLPQPVSKLTRKVHAIKFKIKGMINKG